MGCCCGSKQKLVPEIVWQAARPEQEEHQACHPGLFKYKPVPMEVRVNVDKILEIDQLKETFKAQVFFEGKVRIPKEPKEECQEVCKFVEGLVGQKLSVENAVELTSEGSKFREDSEKEQNLTNLYVTWLIVGVFGESLELQHFPFDCQDFTVTLRFGTPYRENKMNVRLEDSMNSCVVLNVFNLENTWFRPHRLIVRAATTEHQSNSKGHIFPLLHVTVQMQRIPWYFVSNIVTPMLMIAFMGACSTVIPYHNMGERLGASLTLVLTAVAYKYIVAQMVPQIGYNTWLDWYVMCCWCFLFIIVLENCIAVHLWHRSELWKAIYIYSAFMLVNAIFCIWARVVYWRRPSKCSPEEQTGGSYHSCREVTHCYAALDSEDSDSAQSDKSEREV
ncbi:unnamed protein product [Symbiodinium pilosum]|uniref:Neurotransmitter-gated ion-channel transmembrane domain-containing protein n=1 Tax=Symbiodinium pilosum TaxID=2952 RepID=A0A812Y4N9_SYMPI|nr:unnamed protein product [Symbiodinium pilosum]